MSVPDDSLLDEDLGDEVYDLGNEEEEALLAEDCDFEKKSCSKGEEETEDILDLGVTDVLDDLDEQEEKCGPKEYNLNFSNAKKNITSTQIIELENIEKNKTYSGFCSNLESSLDLREKLRKKSINLNYPLTKRKLKSNKDNCNEAKERNRFQNERPPKTMYIDNSYSNSPDVNKTIEKVKPSFRKHYKSKLVTSFNKKIPVEQLTGRFLSPRGIINNNFLFRPHTFENQTKFYSSDYLFTQNVNCNVYNQEARQSPYRNMLHKVSLAVQSQSSNARLIQSSCSQIKSQESHILNSDGTNIKLDSFNVPINSSSLICENLSNQSILKNNQFFPGGPCFQVPHKQESLLQCSLNHFTLIHNQSFSTVPNATAKDSNVNYAEAEHNERLLIRPNMNNLLHPHTTLAQKALPLNYKTPSYNLEGISLNSQANNLHSFENVFTFNNELEYSSHQKEKQASNRIQCNSGSTEIFHPNNPINNDPNLFIDRADKDIESVKIHSLPTGHKILINPHFKGNKTDSEGNISKDVVTAGKKKLNKLNQNLTSDSTSKHDDPFSYFSDVWQENKQPKINQSSRVSSSELFDFYKNSPDSSTALHRDVKIIKKAYKKNEMKENPVKTFEIKNKTRKTEEIEKKIDTSTLSNTNISAKKKSDNVDIGAKIFNKKNSSCQIFIPTKKRAIPASDNSEIDKRLRLERRNLSRKLSPQNLSPEKIEQIDTEMKIYQKRLEEQKKLREKVLREKENRRKLAALTKHL